MRSVAEGTIGAVFAAAEVNRAIFFSRVGSRCESGSLVGSVTEWLRGTFSAGAPVVGLASFDGNGNWGFLSNDWFGHEMSWLIGDVSSRRVAPTSRQFIIPSIPFVKHLIAMLTIP